MHGGGKPNDRVSQLLNRFSKHLDPALWKSLLSHSLRGKQIGVETYVGKMNPDILCSLWHTDTYNFHVCRCTQHAVHNCGYCQGIRCYLFPRRQERKKVRQIPVAKGHCISSQRPSETSKTSANSNTSLILKTGERKLTLHKKIYTSKVSSFQGGNDRVLLWRNTPYL